MKTKIIRNTKQNNLRCMHSIPYIASLIKITYFIWTKRWYPLDNIRSCINCYCISLWPLSLSLSLPKMEPFNSHNYYNTFLVDCSSILQNNSILMESSYSSLEAHQQFAHQKRKSPDGNSTSSFQSKVRLYNYNLQRKSTKVEKPTNSSSYSRFVSN